MSINFTIYESEKLLGVYIIKPSVGEDLRGNIWTSFLEKKISKLIDSNLTFNHDKFSTSKKNVLRGIHGDSKSWKLVTCVYGEIDQVVVDCRKGSPTYLKWEKFRIRSKEPILVLIPPYMGNSYYVRSEEAVYHYKLAYMGEYIDAEDQFSLNWNDPKINIDWGVSNPILSNRDMEK